MLGDIQKAGGIASLRKVDRSQIRDRSGATVGGGSDTGPHGSGLPPAGITPGGGGGMADALAAALQKRKAKVRDSGECFLFLPLLSVFNNILSFSCVMPNSTRWIGSRWLYAECLF